MTSPQSQPKGTITKEAGTTFGRGTIGIIVLLAAFSLGYQQWSKKDLLLNSSSPSCQKEIVTSTGTGLAAGQSFGFFTDISDDQWVVAQTIHAKSFPNYFQLPTDPVANANRWHNNNFHQEFTCPMMERVPIDKKNDGAKWVCDPLRLSNKTDCLVYSVGSNGDPSFEEGVRDQIGPHCEIHTFDIDAKNRIGDFAKILKGTATFHHWGLGGPQQARKDPDRIKTLGQTIKELGHEGRTIDIFKIDCEGCEYQTYKDWLKHDLRQILVETHGARVTTGKLFMDLHDAGYVIFNKEPNLLTSGKCVEYAFVKLSVDFLKGHFYKNYTPPEEISDDEESDDEESDDEESEEEDDDEESDDEESDDEESDDEESDDEESEEESDDEESEEEDDDEESDDEESEDAESEDEDDDESGSTDER